MDIDGEKVTLRKKFPASYESVEGYKTDHSFDYIFKYSEFSERFCWIRYLQIKPSYRAQHNLQIQVSHRPIRVIILKNPT